jgi:hypothetical protein
LISFLVIALVLLFLPRILASSDLAAPSQEVLVEKPSASESPSPSPRLPNTCVDYDTPAGVSFDIHSARLTKNTDGSLLLNLEANFVDTKRGARSSGKPIPVIDADGGWVNLTLRNSTGQESYLVIIANGGYLIPDWESKDYEVEMTGTDLGVDILFSGLGIEENSSGVFEWGVGTKDQGNDRDVCPDQDYDVSLDRLLTYQP